MYEGFNFVVFPIPVDIRYRSLHACSFALYHTQSEYIAEGKDKNREEIRFCAID